VWMPDVEGGKPLLQLVATWAKQDYGRFAGRYHRVLSIFEKSRSRQQMLTDKYMPPQINNRLGWDQSWRRECGRDFHVADRVAVVIASWCPQHF